MTGVAPTVLALPFAVSGLAALSAGAAILVRERLSRVGWMHFLLSTAIAGWQFCTVPAILSKGALEAAVWGHLTGLCVLGIPALQYQFACAVTGRWLPNRRIVLGAWVAVVLLLALHFAGLFHAELVRYPWGYYPLFTSVGWVFIFFALVVVGVSMQMYWRQYRDNRPGSFSSRRGLLLLVGLGIGALAAVDFLPALGIDVFPFGGVALIGFNVVNLYTIWTYRLVEITPAYAAQQLMDSMSDGVLLIDRDGIVRLVNPAASEILGMERAQLVDRLPPRALANEVLGWQHEPFFPAADMALGEREYIAPDGGRRMLDASVALMQEPGLEPGVAVIMLRDITLAVQAQEQIERLAHYDPLTHLPNRLLLKERFEEAVARARRARAMCAVLFLDLDHFKHVNDTLGHDAGDLLLRAVAERVTACVRETDWVCRPAEGASASTLARLGGDEFVLLLSPLDRPEDAAKVANRILGALSRAFVLKRGAEVATGVSIGISVYPHDGDDMETLMKRADLAMYQAKEGGRNTYRFHDETMNASAMARTDLENGLRYGLTRNEFLLCYQPQLAPRGGDIAGLDAQLYWRHPQHGLLPAAEFVAASEDASVVVPLSEWLMRSVCMQLRAWHASGLPPLYLSVTLPPGAAERGDLPRIVRESTAQAGVDPALLIISLRAPPGGRATARTIDAMQALQDMGARLLLEDLGSGPAAFANLGQYPLSMVRFESGFFRSLARDGDLAAITRAVVSMVHSLNLGVIITDVENSAQAAFVREVGCDLAQGPAYGPSVAAEDVPALLTSLGQRLAAG